MKQLFSPSMIIKWESSLDSEEQKILARLIKMAEKFKAFWFLDSESVRLLVSKKSEVPMIQELSVSIKSFAYQKVCDSSSQSDFSFTVSNVGNSDHSLQISGFEKEWDFYYREEFASVFDFLDHISHRIKRSEYLIILDRFASKAAIDYVSAVVKSDSKPAGTNDTDWEKFLIEIKKTNPNLDIVIVPTFSVTTESKHEELKELYTFIQKTKDKIIKHNGSESNKFLLEFTFAIPNKKLFNHSRYLVFNDGTGFELTCSYNSTECFSAIPVHSSLWNIRKTNSKEPIYDHRESVELKTIISDPNQLKWLHVCRSSVTTDINNCKHFGAVVKAINGQYSGQSA